jgi:hypothetical protein
VWGGLQRWMNGRVDGWMGGTQEIRESGIWDLA